MHLGRCVVDTVEGVAAVLDGIDRNPSHDHGSDSPDVDQIGKLDRGFGHSRIHGRDEVAVVADRRWYCRVVHYCVERMNRLEEANARQE